MLRSRYNEIEGNSKSKYFLMIVHSDGHLKELCIKASSRNTTFILTGDIQSGLPPFKPPPFSYSFVSTNIQRSMLAKNVNVIKAIFFRFFSERDDLCGFRWDGVRSRLCPDHHPSHCYPGEHRNRQSFRWANLEIIIFWLDFLFYYFEMVTVGQLIF